MEERKPCPRCDGGGRILGTMGPVTCAHCRGRGYVVSETEARALYDAIIREKRSMRSTLVKEKDLEGDDKKLLAEIAHVISEMLPEGRSFGLFVFDTDKVVTTVGYVSDAKREDLARTVGAWADKERQKS